MVSNPNSNKPLYKPAVIGLGLILGSILVAMAAPVGSRIGWWDYSFAIRLMTWGAYLGAGSSLLCLSGLLMARPGGERRGFVYSLAGLVIIIPVLLFLQSWKTAKSNAPPIQDISTNTQKPPEFWNVDNSRVYSKTIARVQKEYYPDIKPLILSVSADRAFDLALQLIRRNKWTLHKPDRAEKHIEATEKTYWFGFSDDVVIHITPLDKNRSQVDMRSASRFGGGSDGGTNANRIRKFFKSLKRLASAR